MTIYPWCVKTKRNVAVFSSPDYTYKDWLAFIRKNVILNVYDKYGDDWLVIPFLGALAYIKADAVEKL